MASFQELKQRYDTLTAQKAQAEGKMEAIREGWKRDLGTDDPAQVEILQKEAETSLAELQKEYNDTLNKAEEILAGAGV